MNVLIYLIYNINNQYFTMSKSPVIISIAHQKGGVGKSTLAFNLASHFINQGDKCALVDTDYQGTITDIFNSFGEKDSLGGIDLIRKDRISSYASLSKQVDYDLLIVDTPPYISNDLNEIFGISDFVLIPTKPAVNDFLAIDRTIDFARSCMENHSELEVGICINMVVSGSSFTQSIRDELKDKDIRLLKTEIGQRIEFTRYLLYTDSIYKTKDKKAQDEITALGEEIFGIITSKIYRNGRQ